MRVWNSNFVFSYSAGGKEAIVKRIFWNPMRSGERLDYCNEDKSCCGQVVANTYCHIMGYHHANRFRFEPNLGLTHFISGNNACKGWKCSGFSWIECAGKRKYVRPPLSDYTDKLFVKPRWHLYPLAWCYDGHKGCGKRAAYSFCRYQGYEKVKDFRKTFHYATKQIGGGYLCFGSECGGFEYITCSR